MVQKSCKSLIFIDGLGRGKGSKKTLHRAEAHSDSGYEDMASCTLNSSYKCNTE